MPLPAAFVRGAQKAVDLVYDRIPQPVPKPEDRHRAKIIAHRGAWNREIPENTLEAFDRAFTAGVWGIEFDVRWTSDDIPVVIHDPTAERVFNQSVSVTETPFSKLKNLLPQIPRLEEVVDRYGGKLHLMVEIKNETPNKKRKEVLTQTLARLQPRDDFHYLCLQAETIDAFSLEPLDALVLVSETNTRSFTREAKRRNVGGFAGHYLLTTPSIIESHHADNRLIGTGFAESRNLLYRELNRGVDWVFTNQAVLLQNELKVTQSVS